MNDEERRLFQHTATRETGAGFTAIKQGNFATVLPITLKADAWLREHVGQSEDVSWHDGAVVVEMRFFAILADAIMAAGFLFERDALPN